MTFSRAALAGDEGPEVASAKADVEAGLGTLGASAVTRAPVAAGLARLDVLAPTLGPSAAKADAVPVVLVDEGPAIAAETAEVAPDAFHKMEVRAGVDATAVPRRVPTGHALAPAPSPHSRA